MIFSEIKESVVTKKSNRLRPKFSADSILTILSKNFLLQHQNANGVEFNVTPENFMNILNSMSTGNSQTYDLNSLNCTSMTMGALNAGGINFFSNTSITSFNYPNLPLTFVGFSPKGLGDAIKNMAVGSNMTLLSGLETHTNSGSCQ